MPEVKYHDYSMGFFNDRNGSIGRNNMVFFIY